MNVRIDDPADERLRLYAAVRDPELARSSGCFVAEGREVVRRLVARGAHPVRSIVVTDAARAALASTLARLDADVPVFHVSQSTVEALTGFNIHRGCLALADRPAPRPWQDVLIEADGLVVALEEVGNADNVGGVFRNARALGAGAVLLSEGCADPLYRKAIRTSMGATLEVPFARLAPWPAALEEARRLGWFVAALTPHGGVPLGDWARGQARPGRLVVLAGHEGEGLSAAATDRADERVAIPMAPGADSLNVSVAVAIALYAIASRC